MSSPASHCCKDSRTGLPVHDRLDLKQHTLEWSAPACGSINQVTMKPDYCCFQCPTLLAALHVTKGSEL